MLSIAIEKIDIPLLDSCGCQVRINGQATTLCRKDGYLCYDENRCQIIEEFDGGKLIQFFAKSHGKDEEEHAVIWPTLSGDIAVTQA